MARNLFDEFGIDPATLEQPTAEKRDLFAEFDIDPKSLVDAAPIRAEMRRINPSATDAQIDYLTGDKVAEQAKPRQTTEENIQERVANRKKAGASQMGAEQATVFDLNLEQELTRRQNGIPAQVRGDMGAVQREGWQKQHAQAVKDRKPPEDDRGLLGRAGDIGLGVVQGGQDVVKIFGDIYGLTTGDTDNVVSEFGKKSSDFFQSKMSKYQRYMTKADAARLEQIGKDSGLGAQFVAGLYQSVTDPVAFARNAPLMLAGGLGGTATKAAVGTFLKTATEGTLVGIGTAGGVATGAAMQGADVGGDAYERLMNLPQEKWDANKEYRAALMEYSDKAAAKHAVALGLAREAALKAGAISIAANMLPMGDSLERVMAGGKLSGGMAARVAGAGLGEMGSEGVEEGGGKMFANQAVAYIDPTQRSLEGVGVAAGLGVGTGGLMGGAAGAMGGIRPQAAPTPAPRTPTVADIMAPEASVDDAITAAQEMVSAPTDTETSDMVKQAMDNISQLTDGDVITGDDGTEFTFQQTGPGEMPRLLDADGTPLPDELAAPLLSSTDALQGALARRVTQPEEMLDGRTDVGGQDAAMAAQGDEGASVDVPGSGTDTQAGLLGGLAGGSGSAGSMATPAGVDSVAGDAGVPGLGNTVSNITTMPMPSLNQELLLKDGSVVVVSPASNEYFDGDGNIISRDVVKSWRNVGAKQWNQPHWVGVWRPSADGRTLNRVTTPTTPLPEASGATPSVTQAVPASLPVESAAPINQAGEPVAPKFEESQSQESQTQSPQVTSEGVAPAVVVTPAQQKVVDAVNASLVDEQAKLGDKAPPLQQLTVATPEQVTPAVRDALPLAQAFLEAAGYQHEMVVVAPTDDKTLDFDGAVASNGAGIVIAADSARTVPRVVVHEFGHEMRKEAPQVWETLAAEILGRTDKAAQLAHLKKRGYTGETLTPPMAEEFVNDVLSDMLNSGKEGPRILVDVASNMDKAEPGSGKEFLKRLLEFIDKVIKGMVGKGYGTEATILKGEVGAIRKAIAKALTDYNLQAKKAEKAKADAEQQAEDRQSFSYTDAADLANAMYPKPYHSGIGVPTDPLWAERKAQVYIELARNGVQEKASQWFMRDFDGSVTPYSQVQVLVADALGIERTGPWRKTLAQKVFDIALENGRKPGGNPKDKDIRMAILLGSRTGQVSSLTGEKHDTRRQAILKAITGKPVPKSKAGITAVETALVDHLGLKDMTKRDMDLAIEDFAMGRAAKAKQEAAAAKKAALAAEVARAKAKPADPTPAVTMTTREQAEAAIVKQAKAAWNEQTQGSYTPLKQYPAKIKVNGKTIFMALFKKGRGGTVLYGETLSKLMYGYSFTQYKITGDKLEKTGSRNLFAHTKAAIAEQVNNFHEVFGEYAVDVQFGKPEVLYEDDAETAPVEPTPPTDTKTDEVSDASGAKTDAASADGVNDNERLLREMATATEKPGDVLLTNNKYVPFDVVVRMAKDGIASGAFRAAPAQLHFNLDMAMRDVDRVLAAALADGPKRSLRNAAVDELNAKLLEQEGIENAFVPSETGDPGIIDAFKKVFNVEIVPIAGRMDFLGMQFNGRLYVNAEHPNAGFVHIAGHELLHDLARKQPGIYAAFESEARNFSLRDAVPAYARRLGAAGGSQETDTYQEILADFVGEALTDPSFLQQMADANPTKFRMFVNAVTKWLDKVAEKLKFYDLHASDYFKEVKGLREYLVDVLDAYSDTQTLPEYTGIKRSLRNTITVDGQERPTTNSNGKPIAQTEEGLRNFWKWFSDSAVTDKENRPLVVYHGTKSDISNFERQDYASNTGNGGAHAGHYFTPDARYAAHYAQTNGGIGGNIIPTYLYVKNPFYISFRSNPASQTDVSILRATAEMFGFDGLVIDAVDSDNVADYFFDEAKRIVREADGDISALKTARARLEPLLPAEQISIGTSRAATEIVAFDPTQIKSAIGNDGGFDGTNPDIRRSNRDTDAELARKLAHALAGYEQRLQPAFEQALNENQAKSDELKRFIVPHADSERVGEELARETGIGVEQITEMLQGGPIEVNGEMMHPVEVISTAMSLVRINMAQLVDAETADDMTQKMTDTMNLMLSLRANISEVARALSFVGYAERKGGAKGFEIAAQADGKPEVQAADKVAKDAEKAATEAEADAIKAIDDLTKKDGGAFKETEAAEQAERDATDKDNEATDVEKAATDKKREAKKKREAEKLAKEKAKNTTGKAQADAEAEAALSGQEASEADLKALAFETHAKNLRREAGKMRSEAKAARKRAEAALVKGRLLKQDAEVWAADAKRKMDRARKLRAEAIAQKKEAMRVRAQAQRLIAKSHSAIVNAKMQADKANRAVKKMRYSLTKERILEAMGGEAEMQKIFDELKRQGHDVNMHGVIMMFQGMAGQQLKAMKAEEKQYAGPWSKRISKANEIGGMAAELFKAYILSRFSTHALNVVSTWVHRLLEMRITGTLAEMMPSGAGAKKHWQVMRALTGVSASAWTASKFAMHAESRSAQMISLLKMNVRDQKMVIDLTNNKWMDNQDRYLPGTFGKYVRNMGFTPLGMEDAYLKTFPYLYSLALQEAEGRVPDYQEAVEYAETIAFQSHLSPIGKAVNGMIKKVPVLGTHIPFITTLDNLIMKALQYTPGVGVAFVANDQRALELAKATDDPMKIRRAIDLRNKSIARSIVGGMVGLMTLLAYGDDDDEDKILTGLRPTDPNEFAIWRQENGVLAVGFAGYNISFERFDPLSSSVGLTIAAINATKAATDGNDSTSAGGALMQGGYQMLISKTFIEPLMELLLSFRDPDRGGKAAVNYYANLLSAMTVPGAIAQFAELPDDLSRETKPLKSSKSPFTDAYLNKTAAKIPGLRDDLEPALDIWGEAADNPGYLNPLPVRPVKSRPDPLNNWLLKMGKTIHAKPASLDGMPVEKKQELLRKRHDMLTKLMSNTSGMTRGEKKEEVSKTIGEWTRSYVTPARKFYDLGKEVDPNDAIVD